VDIANRETLIECVNTSLSSKVVSANCELLSPMAVDAVLKVVADRENATNVDLKDIRIVKKMGGTIDDTMLVEGIVFDKCKPSSASGGPTKIENAKIAVVQFQIATPKTDLENSVIVKDYQAMDRIMKEERKIIADMVKKIVASGANVLLIQKSILKDATNELSLHFLAKKGIMVVQDIEREEVDFICRSISAIPIAHIDHMTPDKFGHAALCEQSRLLDDTKVFKITGLNNARTVSILVRGSNPLVIDEAERSLHDALCVIRSLIKSRGLITGGGSVELAVATHLQELIKSTKGLETIIFRAYAEALEIIPYTLSENAGMNPINVVTELRNRHAKGEKFAGISVRKGNIVDMKEERVLQPALVTQSALTLATEVVRMILKIDDVVMTAR
jgi:T-complex protein 1 subunit delta